MICKFFSIYDSVPEVYNAPFPARTQEEGKFIFRSLINDPKTRLSQHPSHYSLFEIGTFDDERGFVTQHTAHIPLGHGQEFVNHKLREVVDQAGSL